METIGKTCFMEIVIHDACEENVFVFDTNKRLDLSSTVEMRRQVKAALGNYMFAFYLTVGERL